MKLDIARIQVGQRKRKLDEGKVRSLAESFESIGQLQPDNCSRLQLPGVNMATIE